MELDNKPANILCSNVDGPNPIAKISDLGASAYNYYEHTEESKLTV